MASPTPCPLVGAAAAYCSKGNPTGGGTTPGAPSMPSDPTATLDPLSSLAHSCANAAAWVSDHLGQTLDRGAAAVDFTNSGFLAQYAIVFAASTFMTLVLWLIAVTKRVLRGAPLSVAFGEAIGFLWLTVTASAFTPLVLYVVVQAVDAITTALGGSSYSATFADLATALKQGAMGGGPMMLIVVSAATILSAGILWLELVVRAMALLVGALLGTVVYSGLVDKSLWSKVRRWAGFMVALILVKPVIVICVGIAHAFTAQRGPGATPVVVAGIGVIVVAIGATVAIFRFVPGYGDDIMAGLAIRATKTTARVGTKAVTTAAGVVASGIQTHGGRTPTQRGNQDQPKKGGQGAGGVADGITAHGVRKVNGANDKPKK